MPISITMAMTDEVIGLTTQAVGTIGYALSTVACLRAARLAVNARLWLVLSAIQAACALEIWLQLRIDVANMVRRIAQTEHWYTQRAAAQSVAIALGLLALPGIAFAVARVLPARNASLRFAIAVTSATLFVFLLTMASPHEIDRLLYSRYGPAMGIGWLWLTLGLLTATAAHIRRT